MTCIVGIAHDGAVTIGGDSAGSNGHHVAVRADTKVFRVGAYILGFTTSFRMGQLLRYRLDVPELDTWDVDRFMATRFVDAVRSCLKDGGWASTTSGTEQGGTFLVGVADRLYRIDSDYQIGVPVDGYDAVGSGTMAALGALHATRGADPSTRILAALAAAEHCTEGVRQPFTLLTTDRIDAPHPGVG